MVKDFKCKTCHRRTERGDVEQKENGDRRLERGMESVEMGEEQRLEVVKSFYYRGYVSEAGVEAAVASRIQCAWKKFNELKSILTRKGLSLKVKGRVYGTGVKRVMLYGSKTWAITEENTQRMERTEMQMVRMMCEARLLERKRNEELTRWLGLESVRKVMRRGKLRWFGHVMRSGEDDWLKKCMNLEVGGVRRLGRPRKTLEEVVRRDMRDLNLSREMASDSAEWRRGCDD
jgi:hypothetical protein